MDLYLIWATDGGDYPVYWLVGAWDDDSLTENYEGFEDEVRKHQEEHGANNVRVVRASVNFDAVVKAFEVTDVGSLTIKEDQ